MSKYSSLVPISSITPFNVGLSSASEENMISALGRPTLPLTTTCQNDRASDAVKKLLLTVSVGPFRVTGIRPAIMSLQALFAQVKVSEPGLFKAVGTVGMMCIRMRKPTSGIPSSKISNHSWGTAVDLNIDKGKAPGNTGQMVPLGIALLVPHFNRAGWYSGISFHDDMHFEVAAETIQRWQSNGLLMPALIA
jgi:hypothetical protein